MIVTADLETFERKTFRVKGVRVTANNIQEISEWTKGELVWPEKGAPFVRVPCGAKKENTRAYIGDWITFLMHYNDGVPPADPNFRVYKDHTFLEAFRKIMGEAEKYAAIHEKLMRIARAQDEATFYSLTSEGVLLLIETTAHEICGMV